MIDQARERVIQGGMDGSFEKVERARAGGQIAAWNEALSWLGPLREYARISHAVRHALRPEVRLGSRGADTSTVDNAERRLSFLQWEVQSLVAKHRPQTSSALELLNIIFFRDLEFALASDNLISRKVDAPVALLEPVLARRVGPPTLVAVLYAWVGECVAKAYGETSDFVRIELVHGTPCEVVRVIPREDRGEVWLIDLAAKGTRVEQTRWASWCASSVTDGFVRMTWVQGLVGVLTELFKLLEKWPPMSIDQLSAQLFVLDQIISLQPSETSRWADRAMINTRRGDRSSALDDLKRFFAFHERETAPASIVSLFDDLKR